MGESWQMTSGVSAATKGSRRRHCICSSLKDGAGAQEEPPRSVSALQLQLRSQGWSSSSLTQALLAGLLHSAALMKLRAAFDMDAGNSGSPPRMWS